ncbi:MAG: chorismate synthase [Eubacteriales bacterium]|nr:chorismate synthase [Eubacteriales bacterium]
MKNTFGTSVSVTIFGESHGDMIGAVVDGLAPGIEVDEEFIAAQLTKRRPQSKIDTPRQEKDNFKIVSGVFEGRTTGTPITILIPNENTKSKDYEYGPARPSHADLSAHCKYHGYEDFRGGGHFSGRITAALVAAGALVQPALDNLGIGIGTHILECGGVRDLSFEDLCDEEVTNALFENLQMDDNRFDIVDDDESDNILSINNGPFTDNAENGDGFDADDDFDSDEFDVEFDDEFDDDDFANGWGSGLEYEDAVMYGIELLEDRKFPVLDPDVEDCMTEAILEARSNKDSIGGITETAITGLPVGLGEPWFDSMEGLISHAIFSIGGIKGIEFGAGFECAYMNGSEFNDPLRIERGRIMSTSNNNGGINGGITNGMPVIFSCAVRPTPSIAKKQETVDFVTGQETDIEIKGRHDPAIIRRICPVIDAVTALVIADMLASRFGTDILALDPENFGFGPDDMDF